MPSSRLGYPLSGVAFFSDTATPFSGSLAVGADDDGAGSLWVDLARSEERLRVLANDSPFISACGAVLGAFEDSVSGPWAGASNEGAS